MTGNDLAIVIDKSIVQFDINEERLEELKVECKKMIVSDWRDEEGAKACKEKRKEVRDIRIALDKKRKALKEDVNEFGRYIESEANKYIKPLEALEEHLKTQEDVRTKEQERIKAEEAKKEQERIDGYLSKLRAVNASYDIMTQVPTMTPEVFEVVLAKATADFEAQEALKKEQQAALAAMAEERKRLQDELDKVKKEKEIEEKKLAVAEQKNEKLEQEKLVIASPEITSSIRQVFNFEKFKESFQNDPDQLNRIEVIKSSFPRIEDCWLEIDRLNQVLKSRVSNELKA